MTRTALEIANKLDTWIAKDSREAAAMIRQQHAEIAALRAIFDPATHAHRPDCYGPQIDTHCMGCTMAEREARAAEIDRLKRERHHIYDLLARIHRDGGQYTAENGVEKSCDDAEAQVVTWLDTINGIDALIEQARIAGLAANSLLIAAAPDLLEVCRRLSHVNLFAVDEDVASIIMLALDTVQKATGEKP